MTTVTPSDRAGAASAKRPATIPTQRSGQGLRLLVLGAGEGAAAFRTRAAKAGAELAQRFSVRVTHVVAEEGVGEDDARVVRARAAGLPVLGLDEGAQLIEEPTSEADEVSAEDDTGDVVGEQADDEDEGPEGADTAEGADATVYVSAHVDEVEAADGVEADPVEAVGEVDEAEDVVPLIRPRTKVVPEPIDGGPSDVFTGSALEAMLQFPPLPANEFEAEVEVEATVAGTVDADLGVDVSAAADADALADVVESALIDVASAACGCGEIEAGAESDGAAEAVGACGGEWVCAAGDETGTAGQARMTSEAGAASDVKVAGGMEAACGVQVAGGVGVTGDQVCMAAAPEAGRGAAWTASSVAWALVPFVSFGLLTPVAIGYAAYRLRSRSLAVATVCYSAAIVGAFVASVVAPTHAKGHSIVGDVLTACLAASWLGGTAHSFMIRRRVFK